MTRSTWLTVLAVLCFLVLLVLALFVEGADRKVVDGLFYGGLALFAAAHVPEGT